jgi:hypothetical protein
LGYGIHSYQNSADAHAVIEMACAYDKPVTENYPAFTPAPFDGKRAGLPRRMEQLNNVNYVQVF